jgi:hypothetical protein
MAQRFTSHKAVATSAEFTFWRAACDIKTSKFSNFARSFPDLVVNAQAMAFVSCNFLGDFSYN